MAISRASTERSIHMGNAVNLTSRQPQTVTRASSQKQYRPPHPEFVNAVTRIFYKFIREHNFQGAQAAVATEALLQQQEKQPYVDLLIQKTKEKMGTPLSSTVKDK